MKTFLTRVPRVVLIAVVSSLPVGAPAQSLPAVPKAERAPEIRLSDERITLPITMVEEFPFIDGSVAGVTGKFLFDTGNEQALTVNDHRIPLAGGVTTGKGFFGSGESFVIRMNPLVRDIWVGRLRFDHASKVQSQDATQLEGITPDFIGWIGYYFWTGYAFKLDYAGAHVTFYKGEPASYLAGERVAAELPFYTRRLPNHPIMSARVGDVDAVAAFDTGQYGSIFTTVEQKAEWIRKGVLTPSASKPGTYDLAALTLDGRRLAGIEAMAVSTDRFPAADPIGLSEPTVVSVGYGFLRRYKSVWDYPRKRIWLLKK